MDPGAGPSSAPPDGEVASDGDDRAERPGRREQRGGGIGAAFDALREAKAVAEVRHGATTTTMGVVSCMQIMTMRGL